MGKYAEDKKNESGEYDFSLQLGSFEGVDKRLKDFVHCSILPPAFSIFLTAPFEQGSFTVSGIDKSPSPKIFTPLIAASFFIIR